MPNRGKLTDWNDDRGFGYIKPLDGGPTVFVHISEFPRDRRRPLVTDLVTYEVAIDGRGRTHATSVRFLSAARSRSPRDAPVSTPSRSVGAIAVSVTFLALVCLLASVARVPRFVPVVYVVMSALAYLAYAQDKRAAQNHAWRTGEGTLIGLGLLGGWPGALVARQMLRHKTKKQPFVSIFWASIAVNIGLLVWLAAAAPFAGLS